MNRVAGRPDGSPPDRSGLAGFRLGTTSYILPDAILPNVRWLMERVDDVELVLFEVDDGPNNLPSPEEIHALAGLARQSGLTYTIHLPLDLDCSPAGEGGNDSLEKAGRVIERTLPLEPYAFIAHLDGRDIRGRAGREDLERWTSDACRALESIASRAGSFEILAVENLEGYPADRLDGVLARVPVSRCLDIGHLWMDGIDPLPVLEKCLARTRVIHLHGVTRDTTSAPGRRFADHQSLEHTPLPALQAVVDALVRSRYSGVVTLEVFNESDFLTSKERVMQCLRK